MPPPPGTIPLLPTLPRVTNTYGDVAGSFVPHRYDPMTVFLPDVATIQDRVGEKEQENKRGLFWDLLALPEKVFLGQAFKGAVRGGAECGVGCAVEGFLAGTPAAFASDWLFGTALSKETSAADIRRAFGDKSDQEGWSDFFLNLGIDVALDPVTILLNPFGKTAQGIAKASQGVAALAKANLAAAGETGQILGRIAQHAVVDSFDISASLKKAIDVGDRAALVLKLPFAKAPMFESNLGFKSIALAFGQSLDWTMGAVRVSPLGDLVRKVSTSYPKIADPEGAAAVAKGMKREDIARRQMFSLHQSIMLNKAGPEVMDMVARHPEWHDALVSAAEGGIENLDNAAALTELAARPDVVMRRFRLHRKLATDPEFKALYQTARDADPDAIRAAVSGGNVLKGSDLDETTQEALTALNKLYRTHNDVPLPADLLEAAGLPQRYGAELSLFDEPLTPESIAAVHPESLGKGEIQRQAVNAATPNQEKDVLLRVRERLKQSFDDIQALKPEDRAGFSKYLEARAYAMREIARTEAVGGLMNASFEFYSGPYVYRMMAPEAKALINGHVRSQIAGLGQQGVNVNERFLKNREFTDLLTIEASALAEEIGIKATGYQPLKGLAEAFNKHGADGLWGKIIDKPFIKKLWEIDPEAASFFSTNPLHNDYSRVFASGRGMGKIAFYDSIFDSVLVRGTSKMREVDKTAEFSARPNTVGIIRSNGAGRRIAEPETATLFQKGLAPELQERYSDAVSNIQQNLTERLAAEGADFAKERGIVEKAMDINPKMSADELTVGQGDAASMFTMKTASTRIQNAQSRLDGYKAQLKDAPKGERDRFMELVDEAKKDLDDSKQHFDIARESVKESLSDLRASTNEVVAMMRGKDRDQRQILSAMRGAGQTASQFNRELKLWHALKKEGGLALDDAKALGLKIDDDATIHWFDKGDWEAAKGTLAEINKPDSLRANPIAKALDFVRSHWVPYTVVNPLFLNTRVRDQVSNVLSLMNKGFRHWGSFNEATQTRWAFGRSLAGKGEAASLDATFATRRLPDGSLETLTRREALDFMQSRGTVSAQSMWADEMMQSTEDFVAQHKIPNGAEYVKSAMSAILPIQKGVNSPVIRKGAEFAAFLDDTARMAGWRDAWMRGMSNEQASAHVSEALYNGLRQGTSTERHLLRRVIPFYAFSKWALGQTVDTYLQKPGVLATLGKVRDNSYNTPIAGGPPMDPAQIDTILPQFLKDGLGIPYKNTPEGPRYFMFGGYLPVGEMSQLVAGIQGLFDPQSTNGMLNYIGSKLNPAIKLPLSNILNRDFFSDREVEKFPGEHREFMGMPMEDSTYQIARSMRFLAEIDRLGFFSHDQAKALVQAQVNGKPLGQREQLPFLEKFVGSAFGFGPKNYLLDVSEDTRYARQRQAEKVNESKGLLRRRLIESEGKPAAKEDVDALKLVMADQLAETAMMNQLMQTYGVNAREQMRALKQRDKTALQVLRQREPESPR